MTGEGSSRWSHQSRPGDANYVGIDEFVQRELKRRAEYEARPEIIAKRRRDAEADSRLAADKNATRKRPKLIQTTDYPWLTDEGWIDRQPVKPFKAK